MSEMLEHALEVFLQRGWPVQQHESLPLLHLDYQTDHGHWDCYVQVDDTRRQALAYSVLRERVPPAQRAAMAEFITRANLGLAIGNFEMDFTSGELRYKAGLDVSQSELSVGLMDPLVMAVLEAMDDHLPAIRQVADGTVTPEAAAQALREELDSIDVRVRDRP